MSSETTTNSAGDSDRLAESTDGGGKSLVPSSRGANTALSSTLFSDRPSQQVHNFTGSPQEIWRLIAKACSPDCQDLSELDKQEIAVKYIYCHEVEISADDGEVRNCIRTVLMDPDGKCYAAVSEGIALDAWRMLQVYQGQPINPPEKMTVRRIKTRRGFHTMSLVPA